MLQNNAKSKNTPLELLLHHNTDNCIFLNKKYWLKIFKNNLKEVKPIIGNREIEKISDPTFVKNQLPF
jgi:hypothetical protein